jgi:hypothetical protein
MKRFGTTFTTSLLHEKKRKKIIPLWWKLSGIAAGYTMFVAFLILLLSNTLMRNKTL